MRDMPARGPAQGVFLALRAGRTTLKRRQGEGGGADDEPYAALAPPVFLSLRLQWGEPAIRKDTTEEARSAQGFAGFFVLCRKLYWWRWDGNTLYALLKQ